MDMMDGINTGSMDMNMSNSGSMDMNNMNGMDMNGMNMNNMHGMMHGMMQMTFHFSNRIPMGLLFKSWTVQSDRDLIVAVIVWFIMAMLYEGFKTLRDVLNYLDKKHYNKYNSGREKCGKATVIDADNTIKVVADEYKVVHTSRGVGYYAVSLSLHFVQSALHVIQVGWSYLLMLVAMTFNGWLFLAVCFGAGMGYLLFARARSMMGNFSDKNECCQ